MCLWVSASAHPKSLTPPPKCTSVCGFYDPPYCRFFVSLCFTSLFRDAPVSLKLSPFGRIVFLGCDGPQRVSILTLFCSVPHIPPLLFSPLFLVPLSRAPLVNQVLLSFLLCRTVKHHNPTPFLFRTLWRLMPPRYPGSHRITQCTCAPFSPRPFRAIFFAHPSSQGTFRVLPCPAGGASVFPAALCLRFLDGSFFQPLLFSFSFLP